MSDPKTHLVPVTLPGRGDTFLDQSMAPKVHAFVEEARKRGVDVRFNSAYRSPEQQERLHHDPTAITPATHSLHSAGFAVDVEGFMRMSAHDQKAVREAADAAGLKWGGGFRQADPVHFYVDSPIDRNAAIANATAQYQEYQQHRHPSVSQTRADHTPRAHALEQGSHGTAVNKLQSDLAQLGYKEALGKGGKPDGDFGTHTHDAVETFQRDHHLKVDGKVGHDTQTALQAALQTRTTTSLNDPRHADHPMYQQSLAAVHHSESQHGIAPGLHSERLAAALIPAAKYEGITQIDRVLLSERGDRAFVEQKGSMPGTNDKFAFVDTDKAIHTTIAQSTAALAQVNQQQYELTSINAQTMPAATVEPAISGPVR